jgi:hypothetical protein
MNALDADQVTAMPFSNQFSFTNRNADFDFLVKPLRTASAWKIDYRRRQNDGPLICNNHS